VSSWLATHPSSRVILFVNRSAFCPDYDLPNVLDRNFGFGRVSYAGPIESDAGIPRIDSWFSMAMNLSVTRFVSLINADIVLSSLWHTSIHGLLYRLPSSFRPIVLSTRYNVKVSESSFGKLRFTQDELFDDLDNLMAALDVRPYGPQGIDIFTFYRDNPPFKPSGIPRFLMGRYIWDYWIVAWFGSFCNTIFTEFNPPAFHLQHYGVVGPVPKAEVDHNLKLAGQGRWPRLLFREARWLFKDDRLIPGDFHWTGCLCQPLDYDTKVFR
jgi:hypothetical protein